MLDIIKTLLILFIAADSVLSQTQQTIEWPSLANSPWPILRGDAQGTGRSEFVGPNFSDANIIWTADLPFGIFYGPTIGYDDILFFGSFAVDSDSHNQFYAYYPDGTEYWNYETIFWAPNNMSAIITKDSTVYMGANAGLLYAFSQNGNLKWTSYIGFGERMHLSLDREGNIFTYNQDTLRVVNSRGEITILKYIEKISSPIIFSPDGSTIYFKTGYWHDGYDIDNLNYLNSADLEGNIKWRYKFPESNEAPAAVDNEGNIYVYGNDSLDINKIYLYAFLKNGEVKWKYPIRGYLNGNSVTIDEEGNIIFYCVKGANEPFNYIVSLNHQGTVNWEYQIEPNNNIVYGQVDHGLVCDAKGNIFFGSWQGNFFYALTQQGELLWKIPMFGYEYYSSPAIGSDGTLYIGTSLSTFFQQHINNLIAVSDNPNSINENGNIYKYRLDQNYPNPFNPSTTIQYSLGNVQFVTLKVYDILGREVTVLVNEEKQPGVHKIVFDASQFSSGIYFYEIRMDNFSLVRKMIYLE